MLVPLERERVRPTPAASPPGCCAGGAREHADLESLSAALDELYGGAHGAHRCGRRGRRECAGLRRPAFWTTPLRPGGEPVPGAGGGAAGGAAAPAPRGQDGAFLRRTIRARENGPTWWTASAPRIRRQALRTPSTVRLEAADVRGGGLRGGQAGGCGGMTAAQITAQGSLWERVSAAAGGRADRAVLLRFGTSRSGSPACPAGGLSAAPE